MTLTETLKHVAVAIERWLNRQDTLLSLDTLLHLRPNTTYGILFTMGRCDARGRPEPTATPEDVLLTLMFAIVLRHHLSTTKK